MNSRTAKLLLVILTLFMTLTVINVVVHIFQNDYDTETAIEFSASNSITFKGVYVRDEQIISSNVEGVISYAVNDGGKLSLGETVAQIYTDENQIQINDRIAAIDQEIALLEKIQNPGTQEVAQPAYLASLIDEKYKDIIFCKETGNLSKFSSEKEELLVYLSTMQYVTKEISDFKDKISSLKSERANLMAQKKNPVSEVKASRPAYFASYVDGYEGDITYSSIEKMTSSEIKNITDYTKKTYPSMVVGKLINGYQWKLVGVINDKKDLFEARDEIKLYFPLSDKTITAEIESVRDGDEEGEKIITAVCSEMSYDFVQHRVETVEIQDKEHKGIRISRNAIRVESNPDRIFGPPNIIKNDNHDGTFSYTLPEPVNDVKGVYIRLGEKIVFKKIDVIFEGDDFVISRATTDSSYVQLYDDTIVGGLSLE